MDNRNIRKYKRPRLEKPKNKSIMKIIRKIAGGTTEELSEKSGVSKTTISQFENKRRDPNKDVVINIATGLGVNPDILLYSSGLLPESESNIIKEDPYYYMDKIKKMCNNHTNRYAGQEIDMDSLNQIRTYEYLMKVGSGNNEKEG